MHTVLQTLAIGLSEGAVYALVALGITLIYRTTKILQFAQGQILMVAVFVSLTLNQNAVKSVPLPIAFGFGLLFAILLGLNTDLVVRPTLPGEMRVDWVDWLALVGLLTLSGAMFGPRLVHSISIPAAILAGAITGAVIAAIVLLSLQFFSARGSQTGGSLGWILATVAFATIIQFVAPYIWPANDRLYPSPFSNEKGIPGLGSLFSQRQFFTIIIAFALMLIVDWLYNKTRLGRAMKAVAIDRDAAALMGISAKTTVRWAFILASILAAVGGFLVAPLTFANITMGFSLGINGFIAAVLGGIDSARGAMAGGILLGLFEAALPQVLDKISPTLGKFPQPFVFALFILVLVFRPQGIFGSAIREAR